MPKVNLDVESSEQTISRVVTYDVVRDLVIAMGLPKETRVHYPDSGDAQQLPQSLRERIGQSSFDERTDVLINAEERFLEEDIHKTIIDASNTTPLFIDRKLKTLIAPIYARVEVELSIRFRLPDKARAVRAFNDLRFYASKQRDWFFHEVHYGYLFPKAAYALIRKIHELRESRAGYGEDFSTYLNNHINDQMTILSDQSGENRRYAKEEVQTGILGSTNFIATPGEIERRDEDSSYEFSFDYTFRYDKPITIYMDYPIIVHNQALPHEYYDHQPEFEMARRDVRRDRRTQSLDAFTKNRELTQTLYGVPIPSFLDWYPPNKPSFMQGIFRLLLILQDTKDRQYLFNFKELGFAKLSDELIELIKKERDYIPYYRKSVLHLCLYENDQPKHGSHLEIDEDLNVYFNLNQAKEVLTDLEDGPKPLDLRKRYNVFFGPIINIHHIDSNARQRLTEYGHLTKELIKGFDVRLSADDLPKVKEDGTLAKTELDYIAHQINSRSRPIRFDIRYMNYRVGQYLVIAKEDQ